MYSTRTKGFTLVELMTVIAIVAILAAIAFPSFQGSMRSNRVATTSNELLASFALARTEAIRSKRGAGVCASANGTDCAGGGWNDGWIVWTDSPLGTVGVLDPGETVVRYVKPNQQMTMSGSAVILGFDARGRSMAGVQTLGVKPKDYATPARCVRVTLTGQVRIEQSAC